MPTLEHPFEYKIELVKKLGTLDIEDKALEQVIRKLLFSCSSEEIMAAIKEYMPEYKGKDFYAIKMNAMNRTGRPSLDFSPVRIENEEDLNAVREEIKGSTVTLLRFESESHYAAEMYDADQEWENWVAKQEDL